MDMEAFWSKSSVKVEIKTTWKVEYLWCTVICSTEYEQIYQGSGNMESRQVLAKCYWVLITVHVFFVIRNYKHICQQYK